MALANAQPHESRLYYEFSHLYDLLFRRVFYPRIARVIRSLAVEPGARVLELGVGTGLSLDAYPSHCEVTGIDLAPDMLSRAQRKIRDNGWTHLKVLEMNALDLEFPDDTFDYVMAFHVVTVVPDPVRMIAEAQRVCKPGGNIVIVNHFTSDFPLLGSLTEALDPLTRWLGWRTNVRLKPFIETTSLAVEKVYKLSKGSLYTVVLGRKDHNGFHLAREL